MTANTATTTTTTTYTDHEIAAYLAKSYNISATAATNFVTDTIRGMDALSDAPIDIDEITVGDRQFIVSAFASAHLAGDLGANELEKVSEIANRTHTDALSAAANRRDLEEAIDAALGACASYNAVADAAGMTLDKLYDVITRTRGGVE